MPKICYLCDYRQKKGDFSVAMHRFPKEATTRSAWFKFCGLTEGIDDVTSITICSLHFTSDDFNFPRMGVRGAKILSLKSGAVPTIKKTIPTIKNVSKKHKSRASSTTNNEMLSTLGLMNNESPQPADTSSLHKQDDIDQTILDQFVMDTDLISLTLDIPTDSTQECVSSTDPNKLLETSAVESNQLSSSEIEDLRQSILAADFLSIPFDDCNLDEPGCVVDIPSPPLEAAKDEQNADKLAKKIKDLKDQNRYLRRKVADLKELVNNLKQSYLIPNEAVCVVMEELPPPLRDMVSRKMIRKHKYSTEMRDFAINLHFISPKAYKYVRKYWKNLLPHPATVRDWYAELEESSDL